MYSTYRRRCIIGVSGTGNKNFYSTPIHGVNKSILVQTMFFFLLWGKLLPISCITFLQYKKWFGVDPRRGSAPLYLIVSVFYDCFSKTFFNCWPTSKGADGILLPLSTVRYLFYHSHKWKHLIGRALKIVGCRVSWSYLLFQKKIIFFRLDTHCWPLQKKTVT